MVIYESASRIILATWNTDGWLRLKAIKLESNTIVKEIGLSPSDQQKLVEIINKGIDK